MWRCVGGVHFLQILTVNRRWKKFSSNFYGCRENIFDSDDSLPLDWESIHLSSSGALLTEGGGTSRGQMEFRVMPPSSHLHTLLVTRSGMHVSVSLASSINQPIPRKVTYESIDMTPSIAQNSPIQYSSFGGFSLCHLIHCSRFQHMNAVLDATRRPLGCTITCKPREMG